MGQKLFLQQRSTSVLSHVGAIGLRSGDPSTLINGNGAAASIRGSEPGDWTSGTAASFDEARGDFELAWLVFLANRTEADFDKCQKHRAQTAWKYAMWDSGCKMPTQLALQLLSLWTSESMGNHDSNVMGGADSVD